MSNEPKPTEAALKAATAIMLRYPLALRGADVEAIAKEIDEHCDLPRMIRICLLAQGVVDAAEKEEWYMYIEETPIVDLREALKEKP